MSESARPKRSTVLRDWVSYGMGLYLIFTQSGIPGLFPPPAQPNDTLSWIGMALITVQGGFGVASLIMSRLGGTGGLPSEQAAPDSPGQSAPR